MIVTITCNPAHDITHRLPRLHVGAVNRVAGVTVRPGGKGVNVARVLQRLDSDTLLTGFSSVGFEAELRALGLSTDFVTDLPSVRRTLVLHTDSETTSVWEPGAELADPPTSIRTLTERLERVLPRAEAVVISGSLPPGVPVDLPARIAQLAIDSERPVIVDVSGDALRLAALVPGVWLMPNADELTELGASERDPTLTLLSTHGPNGLMLHTPAGSWRGWLEEPLAGNPTGAGDAAAASVARTLAADRAAGRPIGGNPERLLTDAVAVSAAALAVEHAGDIDLDLARHLAPQVRFEPIDPEQEQP